MSFTDHAYHSGTNARSGGLFRCRAYGKVLKVTRKYVRLVVWEVVSSVDQVRRDNAETVAIDRDTVTAVRRFK